MNQFNIQNVRAEFPILQNQVNGHPLVYMDNGATTQKPRSVIEAIGTYYSTLNSNVHRGVHTLSQKATDAFEESRRKVRAFIHARHEHEVIFTKGTSDAINLLASSFGNAFVQAGDEVLISGMEHHSNIVPWQMLCERTGAILKVVPVLDNGDLDMEAFDAMLNERIRIIAVTYVSNTLGTVNPVKEIIDKAHQYNIPVLLDAAQAIQHIPIDVQALDVDFLAFSGHKIYGPTGIGVLYGKEKWLETMPPYQGGGEMIREVSFAKTTYNDLPFKFEAGTPHIEGAICLGVAIDFLQDLGMEAIGAYEARLLSYARKTLSEIEGLRFIGESQHISSVNSFLIQGIHPYDIGMILDKLGIAVRTGHHCTQPLMDRFEIPGTVRASLALYNTLEEIDILAAGIQKAVHMLK